MYKKIIIKRSIKVIKVIKVICQCLNCAVPKKDTLPVHIILFLLPITINHP